MNLKSWIPNTLTLLNLFSGLVAIVFVINQNYYAVFCAVCLGILFDFFDGFAARMLGVASKLGVELDSLADMVTSGVVPGLVMFYMLLNSLGFEINDYQQFQLLLLIPLLGFVITLASCYRLAKFNIDERQTDSFIGLPTPANCLLITSLPILYIDSRYSFFSEFLTEASVLLIITFISSFLLNSEIHLFSLKIKKNNTKQLKIQLFFVSMCIISLLFQQIVAVPFIMLFYIGLSLFINSRK